MIENIKIRHSIVYDFIVSLVRLANADFELLFFPGQEDLPDKFKFDDKINNWLNETFGIIPDNYKLLLEKYFNSDYIFYKLLIFYIRNFECNTVDDLIDVIKKEDSKKLVETFLKLYRFPRKKEVISLSNIEELVCNNNKAMEFVERADLDEKKKWDLLQICLNPSKVKSELIEFLSWYNKNLFSEISEKVSKKISVYEKDLEKKLRQYGSDYFSLLLNVDYKNLKKKHDISLVISYFGEIGFILFFMGEFAKEDLYVIGYRHMEEYVERKHSLFSNLITFKTLADETRLNMIKLLAKKEWYGDELAKEMCISNSTVSYHLNLMMMEGFVNLNRVDKRSYFSLNKKNLKKTLNEIYGKMIK